MLKYTKVIPYVPTPTRSRPNIPHDDLELAKLDPPMPLKLHCKPWLDEQSLGWTFYYGYLTPITITGLGDNEIHIENLEQLKAESRVPDIMRKVFGSNHLGITAIGYMVSTPQNIVSLMLPPTHPPDNMHVIPAVLETDWYPRELVTLFKVPAKNETIHLEYKTELMRLVPIPRFDNQELIEMSEEELSTHMAENNRYLQDEKNTEGRLTQSGTHMKRIYPKWSAQARRIRNKGDN